MLIKYKFIRTVICLQITLLASVSTIFALNDEIEITKQNEIRFSMVAHYVDENSDRSFEQDPNSTSKEKYFEFFRMRTLFFGKFKERFSYVFHLRGDSDADARNDGTNRNIFMAFIQDKTTENLSLRLGKQLNRINTWDNNNYYLYNNTLYRRRHHVPRITAVGGSAILSTGKHRLTLQILNSGDGSEKESGQTQPARGLHYFGNISDSISLTAFYQNQVHAAQRNSDGSVSDGSEASNDQLYGYGIRWKGEDFRIEFSHAESHVDKRDSDCSSSSCASNDSQRLTLAQLNRNEITKTTYARIYIPVEKYRFVFKYENSSIENPRSTYNSTTDDFGFLNFNRITKVAALEYRPNGSYKVGDEFMYYFAYVNTQDTVDDPENLVSDDQITEEVYYLGFRLQIDSNFF